MSNGEPLRRISPVAPVLAGLAALATGVVFYYYGLAATAFIVGMWFHEGGNTTQALQPLVIVLAAALAVTVAGRWPGVLRGSGWLITMGGLAAVLTALLLKPAPSLQADNPMAGVLGPVEADRVLSVVLEAGLGIAVAGVLLATALPGAIRLAAGLGLAAGIALGQPVLVLLTEPRAGAEPLDLDLILPTTALGLALIAAVAGARHRTAVPPAVPAPGAAPEGEAGTAEHEAATAEAGQGAKPPVVAADEAAPRRRPAVWGAAVAVLVAAAAMHAGRLLLLAAVKELEVSRDGVRTQRRAEFTEDLARYGLVAIAVAAALVLTWYAYRRGKADLAAWPVLCFALATPWRWPCGRSRRSGSRRTRWR